MERDTTSPVRIHLVVSLLFGILLGFSTYLILRDFPQWTLLPYAKLLGCIFGFSFRYADNSYFALGSGLVITESCSGINLMLSSYGIVLVSLLPRLHRRFHFSTITVGLAFSILSAFFATLLRIIISLPIINSSHFKLIHTILSLLLFFATGIVVWYIAQAFLRRFHKWTNNKE